MIRCGAGGGGDGTAPGTLNPTPGFTATALVLIVATRGRLGYDAYLRRAAS